MSLFDKDSKFWDCLKLALSISLVIVSSDHFFGHGASVDAKDAAAAPAAVGGVWLGVRSALGLLKG